MYNLHKIVSKFIKGADSKRKPTIKEFLHAFDIFPLAEVSSSRINEVWAKTAVQNYTPLSRLGECVILGGAGSGGGIGS